MINKKQQILNAIKQRENLCVFSLYLIVHLIFFLKLFLSYFPIDDDCALICNSTPYTGSLNILSFISEGFTNYFVIYPEWTIPTTNFLRPVVNLIFLLNYFIFGDTWRCYLLFGYLANSLGITLSYIIAKNYLKLDRRYAFLASLIMFLSNAIASGVSSPSFIFDTVASVFAVLSFIYLYHRRFILSFICLTLTTFTKETTIFCTVTLMYTYLSRNKFTISKKTISKLVLLLLPITFWAILRIFYFDGIFGRQSYVIKYNLKTASILFPIIQRMSFWPSYITDYMDLLNIKLWVWGKQTIFSLVKIATNSILFIYTFYILIKSIINKQTDLAVRNIAVWIISPSLILIVLALPTRFAYIFYMLAIPFFIYHLKKHKSLLKILPYLFLILITIRGSTSLYRYSIKQLDWTYNVDFKKVFNRNKQLVHTLKNIQLKPGEHMFFIGQNRSKWEACFAKKKNATPFINLLGIRSKSIILTNYNLELMDKSTIKITLPQGHLFALGYIDLGLLLKDATIEKTGASFRRNNNISYFFPEAKVKKGIFKNNTLINYGKEAIIKITNIKGPLIYFDKKINDYRIIYLNG